MNITLRQLRAFVALADTRQFTRAAEQLHVSQAALSMLIRNLEEQVGLSLFDRHTRRVSLTDPGRELLGMARRVLTEVEDAVQHSRDLTSFQRGRVAIACGTVLSTTLVIPFIQHFQSEYPGIKVQLLDMAEQDIYRRLEQESIDLGLGTRWNLPEEIEGQQVFQDSYQALLPHGHPLSQQPEVTWEQLTAHPFIALSSGSPLSQKLHRQLASLDIRLKPVHEVSFHSTVLSMVRSGLGLSVLPDNARALPDAAQIVFRPLVGPVLTRQVCLFQQRHRALTPAAGLFKRMLLDYVQQSV